MLHRIRMITAATMIAVLAAVLAGCSSGDTVTANNTPAAATAAVPAFSDIQKAVTLDEGDAAVVQQALADWRQAASTTTRNRFERHQAGMDFVAAVAPSLDNKQLSNLVDYLVTWRDQQRTRMQQNQQNGDRLRDRDRIRDHLGPMGDPAKLMESLGLSDQQKTAVQAMHQEMRQKMEALHTSIRNGSMSRDEAHKAMTALHETMHQKLATILTADQMTKFDAARQERMKAMIQRRIDNMGDRAEARVKWMSTVLGMDDAQTSRFRETVQTLTQKRKAELETLRNGTLAPGDGHQLAMRENRDAMDQALADILTQDQSARLDIIRRLAPQGPRTF